MSQNARLAADERKPRPTVDLTPVWETLQPVGTVNGATRELVDAFCARKRITKAALEALGARYAVHDGRACLAFAGVNGSGRVTAVKYRPLDGSSHDTTAENRSVWVRPIVVGDLLALNWLVAEGETDAARLLELCDGRAAVLVLPAGAATFKPDWARIVPRGATVWLAHDHDDDGDKGAAKAAATLGGKTVRLRPPEGVNDWCDFDGGGREFVELLAVARHGLAQLEPLNLAELLAGRYRRRSGCGRAGSRAASSRSWSPIRKSANRCSRSASSPRFDAASGSSGPSARAAAPASSISRTRSTKCRNAYARFGVTASDHDGLAYFHMPRLDLVSPEAEQVVRELIQRHELNRLVIDSARRAAPRLDENDSQSVSAVFTPLRRVSAETQAAIPVVHHARKRIGDNPTDAGQMVRGSGDLVASVDALFYLRAKESGSFTLETVSRRGLPHEPILVHVEADDDETLRLVNAGPVALADDKVEAMLSRIVKVLEAEGGTLERQVIALRVDGDVRDGTFQRALKLGWQRGLLAKTDPARVGDKTLYARAEKP